MAGGGSSSHLGPGVGSACVLARKRFSCPYQGMVMGLRVGSHWRIGIGLQMTSFSWALVHAGADGEAA